MSEDGDKDLQKHKQTITFVEATPTSHKYTFEGASIKKLWQQDWQKLMDDVLVCRRLRNHFTVYVNHVKLD